MTELRLAPTDIKPGSNHCATSRPGTVVHAIEFAGGGAKIACSLGRQAFSSSQDGLYAQLHAIRRNS